MQADSIRLYNLILRDPNTTQAVVREHLGAWARARGLGAQLEAHFQEADRDRTRLYHFLVNNTAGDAAEYVHRIWVWKTRILTLLVHKSVKKCFLPLIKLI
jgi:hypothetical protein